MNEVRPLVRIIQGQLRGVLQKSVHGKRYAAFKGIPYAKPPTGDRRFHDPVPAEPWTTVRDASEFGPNCAQLDPMTRAPVGGDDCLYLNVYTPTHDTRQSPTASRAVMFWIHGGLFVNGSGDDALYGADYIVEKDVVLVTINYRLNVLGFLNLDDGIITGNQGLKDQVLALKWVQENIAHFGGDPKNVTIFGESAGGSSVHYLTMSPLAKGLFHKAISQSGVAINPWASVSGSQKIYAQELALALGRKIQDSRSLAEFLRTIDAQKLAEVDKDISVNIAQMANRYFVPSVDGTSKNPFLPVPPKVAAQSGIDVPYMAGYNSHEGIIFLIALSAAKLQSLNADFEKVVSPGVKEMLRDRGLEVSDLRKIYFGDKPVSLETRYNYMEMHSDLLFICGVHETARIQALKKSSPMYMYKFSYDNGKSLLKSNFRLDMPGACHTDELSYILYPKVSALLGIPPPEPGSTDHLVTERMTQMWTNFAKTGNPTPAITETLPVQWKPVENSEDLEYLNIAENLQMESTKNFNDHLVKKSTSKL